jgi:hypothetical protein
MKKTWMALFVFGTLLSCASPAEKACTKMASLCSEDAAEAAQCTKDIEELDKAVGGGVVAQKFASCTSTATTCAEAIGCEVGAGASGISKASDQFLKGLTK